MDIKFIRDDTAKEREKKFREIFDILNKDIKKEKDLIVGEKFIKAIILSTRKRIKKEEGIREQALALQKAREIRQREVEPEIEKLKPKIKVVEEIKIEKPREERLQPIMYSLVSLNEKNLVKIIIDLNTKKYDLKEPEINPVIIGKIKPLVERKIKRYSNILDNKKFLFKKIKKACKKAKVDFNEAYLEPIKYYLLRDIINFGKIDALLYDSSINAVVYEGINKPLKINHRQFGELESNVTFKDNKEVNVLINKFAKVTGERISRHKPMLNVRYKQFRVQATLDKINSRLVIKREAQDLNII